MRSIAISLAVLCALGLAGCDRKPKEDKTVTINSPDGKVTISGNGEKFTMHAHDGSSTVEINGAGTSVKMPDYAPLFPGAKVLSSVLGNGSNGTGGMVSFSTSASPQDVIDFYKAKAKESGFEDAMSMNTGGTLMYAANATGGSKSMQITATKDDKGTNAQVVWSVK